MREVGGRGADRQKDGQTEYILSDTEKCHPCVSVFEVVVVAGWEDRQLAEMSVRSHAAASGSRTRPALHR